MFVTLLQVYSPVVTVYLAIIIVVSRLSYSTVDNSNKMTIILMTESTAPLAIPNPSRPLQYSPRGPSPSKTHTLVLTPSQPAPEDSPSVSKIMKGAWHKICCSTVDKACVV